MLDDTAPLMRTIANEQLRSTQRNFEEESFDGQSWPELAPATTRAFITGTPGKRAPRRKKRGKGWTKERGKRRGKEKILHPTGQHLLQKIHQSHTKDEARVSCGTPWAFVHNFGAPMQDFQMPQRTFMGITDKDEQNIVLAADFHVSRALARAVGGR